jgi:prepilin-type N-terminal cleavage/methylation domain-containing protein
VRARGDDGFTLLELLVSLVVFAALAALVYGIARMGTRSWESGMARIDEAESLRIGWIFVQGALSNCRAVPFADPDIPGIHFVGAAHAVEFVAEVPAYLAGGGLSVLRLQLEPDADTEHERLVLRSAPLGGDAVESQRTTEKVREAVLAENVAALAIHYYGSPGDGGGDLRWYPEWLQESSLPTLVMIEVALEDGQRWPVLIAHPRLARPGGDASGGDEEAAPVAVDGQRRPPGGWQRMNRRVD